ncbi:myo-inositol-1(or 4)-monophosphatase [Nocardioides sp. YR527]|uniref:inositol monophosphatase family protein n=1 Tax=Nocardioides sp. YR527 TaxID=1881028 RepID=UPI00088B62D4|nr:inositol monophosphatase family protein [Nocardioides sp. YR527]SDJ77997.1 myo-inositol-1(or 4)-monophosphatase [Nocardioides sp. YR527]
MTEHPAPAQPAPKPGDLLALAVATARAAADLVRERAAGVVEVAATKSTATDVVTEADRDTETLIRRLISQERPEDAFFGEEGEETMGTSGVRWIVDPIDGTVNFLYGLASYAVSIAAEYAGEVVAGAVVDVPRGTLYAAFRQPDGSVAAVKNGEPIGVRQPAELGQRLIATGFSYDAELRRVQAEALVRLLPVVRDVRRIGSAALDICGVAEGTLDGYLEEGLHLWDHAAAGLVAEAAGARWEATTGISGRRFVIVAPAHGYDELRKAAVQAGFLPVDSLPGVVPD